MFLLWFITFVLLGTIGFAVIFRFNEDDNKGVLIGLSTVVFVVSTITVFTMISSAINLHVEIKDDLIKIELLKENLRSDRVIGLKDLDASNVLDYTFLIEKAYEYNDKIIDWKEANVFWRSGIYIPDEVNNLELIE